MVGEWWWSDLCPTTLFFYIHRINHLHMKFTNLPVRLYFPITFLLPLMLLFLAAYGCQKEGTVEKAEPLETPNPTAVVDTKQENFAGPGEATSDIHGQQIRSILYHYTSAVKNACATIAHKNMIFSALSTDIVGYGTSISALVAQSPAFGATLNYYLHESIVNHNFYPRGVEPDIEAKLAEPNWDANTYLLGKMTEDGVALDPVVYSLNEFSTCNQALAPSFGVGEPIGTSEEVNGWKNNQETVLSETNTTSREVFVFVGAVEKGNKVEDRNSYSEYDNYSMGVNYDHGKVTWETANGTETSVNYEWNAKYKWWNSFKFVRSGLLNGPGDYNIYDNYNAYRIKVGVFSNFNNYSVWEKRIYVNPWHEIY